jgi:hypothetical protein
LRMQLTFFTMLLEAVLALIRGVLATGCLGSPNGRSVLRPGQLACHQREGSRKTPAQTGPDGG